MADGPYSRLYHQIADEFPDIFMDDASLGLFARLLVLHDQAWPSAAMYPYATKPRVLARLVESGLVVPEDGPGRYRIKGLDKEREKRSQSASHAARIRHGNATSSADRIANGSAPRTLGALRK